MRIAALLMAVLVTGCGFQLQGQRAWPEQWRGYVLEYSAQQPDDVAFAHLLEEALRMRGLSPGGAEPLRLRIVALKDRKTVAAIGGDGKAVEFDLRQQLRFRYLAGDRLSETHSLEASRRLSFDPAAVLAKDAEEARLREALSRELIELMLLRIESELRARALTEEASDAS